MAIELIICPTCFSKNVNLYGKTKLNKQRYRCKNCHRAFILDYSYNGHKKQVLEYIVPMTLNGSGIRDISRVLNISVNTVLNVIRNRATFLPPSASVLPPGTVQNVEIDELWSYVARKSNQRWLWYAYERDQKKILAFVIDRRTDDACQRIVRMLSLYTIEHIYTDNWDSYTKYVDPQCHIISKVETQRIERMNLNFRTHLKRLQRKTICFSKSDDMHYAVLSLYINYENSS